MDYYIMGILLCIGIIVGIFLTFACIRIAMVLPMFGYPTKQDKQSSNSSKVKEKRQPRWDPAGIMPPTYSLGGGGTISGPGPKHIEYDSVDEFYNNELLDPIDPKKQNNKNVE